MNSYKHFTTLKKLQYFNSNFSYADLVSVGDEVLVQGNSDILPTRVINVSNIMFEGDQWSCFKIDES